ncbi:VOC family protein [Nonomuraea sp. NPDC050328]|uniref:VOC family protein n=1 Tax=Nonomuraea sp. NPDC050328 TaxID=3364361 RepID=UPI003790669E
MTITMYGTVAWFEIAADNLDDAQHFYEQMFGWQISKDEHGVAAGPEYRLITTPGGEAPAGGLRGTTTATPGHAVFSIAVQDVAQTCAEAERLGGNLTVVHQASDTGPANAYLRDPAGNLFGVFSPPGTDTD